MLDKRDLLNYILLHKKEVFEIDLGCGNRKRSATAIGIDKLDYPCVDIVGEIGDVLSSIPEDSITTVRSFHALEHIENVDVVIRRVEAILKEGGELHIVVPHFSNPYFYSDYTHRRFFGLYSLSYLAKDSIFRRRVPTYGVSSTLTLKDVRLRFKSTPPFYGKHAIKAVISKIINSSRYLQETYEELFCWILPCYEIEYYLSKGKSIAKSDSATTEGAQSDSDELRNREVAGNAKAR